MRRSLNIEAEQTLFAGAVLIGDRHWRSHPFANSMERHTIQQGTTVTPYRRAIPVNVSALHTRKKCPKAGIHKNILQKLSGRLSVHANLPPLFTDTPCRNHYGGSGEIAKG